MLRTSTLELDADERARHNNRQPNKPQYLYEPPPKNPEVEGSPPPKEFSFMNRAAPFDPYTLGGSEYNLGYVPSRMELSKSLSGERMLERPPRVQEQVGQLYSWSPASKRVSKATPMTSSRAAKPEPSSLSLPALSSPGTSTTTTTSPGHPHPRPHHSLAEVNNAKQLISNLTVKGGRGTWQNVHRNEWDVDRPALRADTDGLALGFHLAMGVVDQSQSGASIQPGIKSSQHHKGAEGDDTSTTALLSSLENDLLVIKAEVSNALDERGTLHQLFVPEAAGIERLGLQPGSSPDPELQTSRDLVKDAVGLSEVTWQEIKESLSICMYEQKWADLTCDQLCNQVSVVCRQHGDLLRLLRLRYASVFTRLSDMYAQNLWQLERAVATLLNTKQTFHEAKANWDTTRDKLNEEVNKLQVEMERQQGVAHERQEAIQLESRDQVRKMGETLRTLNGIFRNMQTDVETMRAADLKDQIETLRSDLHDRRAELAELRPVVETVHKTQERLKEAQEELAQVKEERSQLQADLKRREVMIQELMLSKSQLMAENERLQQDLNRGDGKGLGDSDSATRTKRAVVASSILCARCNQALDETARVDNISLDSSNRQPCYAYRLMIPNLTTTIPERTVKWTRQCMRAIIRSKINEVALIGYTQQPVTRFPEFVYAWFDPSKNSLEGLAREDKLRILDQANDHRWGLYYGVKALARENAEARLFWSFLDESYGMDYLTFYLYCLNLAESIAGISLHTQWGPHIPRGTTHERLDAALEQEAVFASAAPAAGGSGEVKGKEGEQHEAAAVSEKKDFGGQETLWIGLRHAKAATDIILTKTSKEQQVKIWDAVKALAVSSTDRLPVIPDSTGDEECVELYLWLRILMQSYRQDQINRRAAIKLMFTTSLSGVMTSDLDYEPGRSRNRLKEDDENPQLNLPQTLAMVRTLWPQVSTTECVTLFREMHEEGGGKVDYETFMKVAERLQLFSRSLQLPSFVLAKVERRLDKSLHIDLDALVHLHYTAMSPYYERIKDLLPDQARGRFEALESDLKKVLDLRRKLGAEVDGFCPLYAYRRLLNCAHHMRMALYETQSNYAGLLTGCHFDSTKLWKIFKQEIVTMERALLDSSDDQGLLLYDALAKKLAAQKLQKVWRQRIKEVTLVGTPLSVVKFMRKGYLIGRGGIRSQRTNLPIGDVQTTVGEIMAYYLHMDAARITLSLPMPALPQLVYLFFLKTYGTRSVAERALQDFFQNLRKYVLSVSRLHMFGVLLGMVESDKDLRYPEILQSKAALDFYLRAVLLLQQREACRRESAIMNEGGPAGGGGAEGEVQRKPPSGIQKKASRLTIGSEKFMYPITYLDGKGRKVWEMPQDEIKEAVEELFEKVIVESSLEYMDMMTRIKALENVTTGMVDVDDFLWVIMMCWSGIIAGREIKARSLITTTAINPIKHVLSTVHFKELEDQLAVDFPDNLSESDKAQMSLIAFYQASSYVDKHPKRDPTDQLVATLRHRLTVDTLAPRTSRTVIPSSSSSYTIDQVASAWSMYEVPIKSLINEVLARRTSSITAPPVTITGRRTFAQSTPSSTTTTTTPEPAESQGDNASSITSGAKDKALVKALVMQIQDLVVELEKNLQRHTGANAVTAELEAELEQELTLHGTKDVELWPVLRSIIAKVYEVQAISGDFPSQVEFLPVNQ